MRAVGSSGTTQVQASSGGLTGTALVTAGPPIVVEVTLSPAAASLAKGTKLQYDAAAIYSDGVKVDVTADPSTVWTAIPAGIASVTADGWVTGNAAGSATVSATALGVTGATPLTVTLATLASIAISPTDPSVPNGLPQPFGATGVFSDGTVEDLTDQVTWDTDTHAVATMDALGVASTHAAGGPIVVTATHLATAIAGSTTLTVTNATQSAYAIDQGSATIAKGTTFPFTASGTYSDGSVIDLTALSTWASDAGAVATVSNAAGREGLATGVAPGTANVTAAFAGTSDFVPVTVTTAVLQAVTISLPAGGSATVPRGVTQPLLATGTFSDGSTQDLTAAAGWTSSVTTCAAVSNAPGTEGIVTGVGAGTTTITAAYEGLSGTFAITVSGALIASIEVQPATTTLPVSYTRQYKAIATYSDTSTRDVTIQVTWGSSNGAVATISNAAGRQGLATGVAASGTAVSITARLGGKTGTASLTVTNATLSSITVTPNPWQVTVSSGAGKNHTQQLTATGVFSDGLRLDVTHQVIWSSTNRRKASVSQAGLVTGVATSASVIITASKGGGPSMKSGTATGSVVP
ncbi:MAG TPA: Ig-like domain-containing protein [Anaeromyxobacter sp.]